jgi:hypothetical protein
LTHFWQENRHPGTAIADLYGARRWKESRFRQFVRRKTVEVDSVSPICTAQDGGSGFGFADLYGARRWKWIRFRRFARRKTVEVDSV